MSKYANSQGPVYLPMEVVATVTFCCPICSQHVKEAWVNKHPDYDLPRIVSCTQGLSCSNAREFLVCWEEASCEGCKYKVDCLSQPAVRAKIIERKRRH